MLILLLVGVLVIQIIFGCLMKMVARNNNKDQVYWFIIGLLLGPFALACIPFIKYSIKAK